MEYGITSLYVWEEGVAKTLTLRGAFHQTRDVHHVQKGRNFTEKMSTESIRMEARVMTLSNITEKIKLLLEIHLY